MDGSINPSDESSKTSQVDLPLSASELPRRSNNPGLASGSLFGSLRDENVSQIALQIAGQIAKALGIPPEELFCEDCRKCMFLKNYYRKKRGHLIPDEGIDEDYSYRKHADPDDEGILYDNLD